jgi:Tfp pilus assembly protein PilP
MRRLQLQRKVLRSEVRGPGPIRSRHVVVVLLLSLMVGMLVARVSGQDKPSPRRARPTTPASEQKTQAPVEDYRYDAQGQRDPLEPLLKEVPPEALRPKPQDAARPLGPLERFDISALKLVGIVWGDLGRRGLIKAPDGKSYFATLDTYMGKYSGKVIAIENDRLVIEEQYLNAEDKVVPKTLTIPLRRKDKKEG